jgi:hypothetical protein
MKPPALPSPPGGNPPLSDTRFDGMHVYKFMSYLGSVAVYDIRGKYFYKANSLRRVYEIRGEYIHKAYYKASKAVFEIHGDKIRKLRSTSQAIYEIRD